jgi:uncharacterized protein
MYGLEVSPERLHQVELGESFLREIGVVGDLRVRHRGTEARIEVRASEFDRVRAHRVAIVERMLELGFQRVALDLRGYRRGSLLAMSDEDLETLAPPA